MQKQLSNANYPIWIPVFIGFIFRIVNLNSPIVGIHSWRQADTAAMARHFALQGTPIWLPQIDWAGANQGYVECEFPIFPYLVGQLYKFFGIHEWIGRGLSVFLSTLTILLLIRIGTLILDPISGWWGGLFFSLLPINIYYGRTFQAESLLLFLAAFSIERLLAWKNKSNIFFLFISWCTFSLACLIKLLPFFWLGLPLLFIQSNCLGNPSDSYFQKLFKGFVRTLKSPWTWVYTFSAIMFSVIWFWYAYNLGQSSGYSFFIWGKDTDRISLDMLFNLKVWSNLILRITIRNLSVLGLPLLLLGMWSCKKEFKASILYSGIFGIFFCTIFAMRSSAVHEYYQLPLQLFICPLMGRGWLSMRSYVSDKNISKHLMNFVISLMTCISLTVLSIDYWLVEKNQADIWMPLAENIRKNVGSESRIVTVTGLDPTLLNLARRQGWLSSAENVDQSNIIYWVNQGAEYIAGSLNWQESYMPLDKANAQNILNNLPCSSENSFCSMEPNYTYLIPLNELLE